MSTRCLAVAAALVLSACPLPGPETLMENINARVYVTGVQQGDQFTMTIADQKKESHIQSSDALTVYWRLPLGTHGGEARIDRRNAALCSSFVVEVKAGHVASASVDFHNASSCSENSDDAGIRDTGYGDGPAHLDAGLGDSTLPDSTMPDSSRPDNRPPDSDNDDHRQYDGATESGLVDVATDDRSGEDHTSEHRDGCHLCDSDGDNRQSLFVEFAEQLELTSGCSGPCRQQTVVDDETELELQIDEQPSMSDNIPRADFELLIYDVLSSDADRLFAGNDSRCPQPRPGNPNRRVLFVRKRLVDNGGDDLVEVEDQVDVTDCHGGVAGRLGLRLDFLRDILFPGQDMNGQ